MNFAFPSPVDPSTSTIVQGKRTNNIVNSNDNAEPGVFPLAMSSGFHMALEILSHSCCSVDNIVAEDDNAYKNDDMFVIRDIPKNFIDSIPNDNHKNELIDNEVKDNKIRDKVSDVEEAGIRKGNESPTSSAVDVNAHVDDDTSFLPFSLYQEVHDTVVSITPLKSRKRTREQKKKLVLRFVDEDDSNANASTTRNNLCSIRNTLSRYDMTDQEIKDAWLQSDEFLYIQRRDQGLVKHIEQQQQRYPYQQQPQICTRGLESRLRLESLRKQSHRLIGLEEVLVELERQWDHYDNGSNRSCSCDDNDVMANTNAYATNGTTTGAMFRYDFDAFARVYGHVSRECKIQAEQIARKDCMEVEAFLELEERQRMHTNINMNTKTKKYTNKPSAVARHFSWNDLSSYQPQPMDICCKEEECEDDEYEHEYIYESSPMTVTTAAASAPLQHHFSLSRQSSV